MLDAEKREIKLFPLIAPPRRAVANSAMSDRRLVRLQLIE